MAATTVHEKAHEPVADVRVEGSRASCVSSRLTVNNDPQIR